MKTKLFILYLIGLTFLLLGSAASLVADTPSAGDTRTVTVEGIDYIFHYAPAGTFLMGSPEEENDRYGDSPQFEATLTKGFWIMESEVTEGMWKSLMDPEHQNPSRMKKPQKNISWYDAQKFCARVSERSGERFELPTEAQWEYACRAGSTGAYAGELDDMAWYVKNSGYYAHPVAEKTPNAWGLYDMHGNLAEFCRDGYAPYPTQPTSDPVGPETAPNKNLRGGSWIGCLDDCRSAIRCEIDPTHRFNTVGFRMILSEE